MSECEACGTDPYELDQYIAELEARASAAHAKGREEGLREAAALCKQLAGSGNGSCDFARTQCAAAIEKLLEKK